jgi:hypothetical protein
MHMSVVSLPSVNALKMFLDVGGFKDIRVVVDPDLYASSVAGKGRTFSAACITASPRQHEIDPSQWVQKYEAGLLSTLLPLDSVESLYRAYCLSEEVDEMPELARLASEIISGSALDQNRALELLQTRVPDIYTFEIYKNLRYAPQDKISLEFAKCLVASGNHEKGEEVLLRITRKINADWRALYRSFCIIAWVALARGDLISATRYSDLCRISNPQLPEALIQAGVCIFGKGNGE